MEHPLIQSLFDDLEPSPQTVTELNLEIKSALEQRFNNVWVEAEITNFSVASSGHWYFSLTDGESFIKAVCFKGTNWRIRFKPFDGLQVRVRGNITSWERRSEYQLAVESLQPVGEGALTVAFEQIKAKLANEGLFDEALKRPIPVYPRRVGVVTSPTGAAIHDILNVLERRARSVHIVIIPTQVQGETAGEQIARAIANANKFSGSAPLEQKIDVLIVGRGGGSAEDLWAFNEERVARAIRASNIPVISAVGHEIDFTIADMVADLRAPTPSAAAEIVARAEAEIIEHLDRSTADLFNSISYKLLWARNELQELALSPAFQLFPADVKSLGSQIENLIENAADSIESRLRRVNERLGRASAALTPIYLASRIARNDRRLALIEQRITSKASELTGDRERSLATAVTRLDALSPLAVLTRGYSITQNSSGEIIRNVHQTDVGERIKVRVANGRLSAEVKELLED
ncbi:MAG: exodeoxyribonuclease VII large subunit [Pyrinomonadaceae bacterium]